VDGYHEEEVAGSGAEEAGVRVVLKLHKRIAPVKVALFPLMKKEGLPERAGKICDAIKMKWRTQYDDAGSIGKRYRRADEAGVPLAITVDTEVGSVTVRDRDSMKQERVSETQIVDYLAKALS
jgi:glycyl-tRNA synthetase